MSDKNEVILGALGQLNPENDDHWTGDGAPKLDALKELGVEASRKEVTEAAPTFSRANPTFAAAAEENNDEETPDAQEAEGSAEAGATPPEVNEADEPSEEPVPGQVLEGFEEEFDTITSRRGEISERIEAINAEIDLLTAEKTKLQKEDDRLDSHLRKIAPPPNHAQAMQAYLASQRDLRLRRAAGVARLEELAGGTLPTGISKAPIDRVRQRSIGHGHQVKPVPPLQTQEG